MFNNDGPSLPTSSTPDVYLLLRNLTIAVPLAKCWIISRNMIPPAAAD